jgi:hypothetical protein
VEDEGKPPLMEVFFIRWGERRGQRCVRLKKNGGIKKKSPT